MNEERAGREGSSRGSGGSRDAFGAAGGPPGESGGLPRQGEQARGAGLGRRRAAAAPEFGPADLAAALSHSVSAIGTSGPPRAGLARIRRRAKARQRRRTVMASSAGVLVLAIGVGAATGSSFNIVPVLTGVVGLGHGSGSDGAPSPMPLSGGSGQVRTVRPSAATVGKKGPAIGPGAPAAVSAALAATGIPACTAADLKMTASVDSVIGGVSYGHVEAVANTTCAVAGPPQLQVENAAGTAVGSVVILQHEASDGSVLPSVSTWGVVLKLQAGQGYDFQFAWAPDACPTGGSGTAGATGGASPSGGQSTAASPGPSGASGAPNAAASGAANGGANAGAPGQSAETAYSLSYLVGSAMPNAPVGLNAACGATVYVTDIYNEGAYPLAQQPTAAPTPQPSTTSAPAAPSQSPTTQPPTSAAPTTTSTSPAPPSSSPTTATATPSASSPTTTGDNNAGNSTPDAPTSS
jgi:hypothetical protein